ncbi:MAG: isopentenyl-diphosphate Delta-isomerase, partial [Halobacteriaceae archaeon]
MGESESTQMDANEPADHENAGQEVIAVGPDDTPEGTVNRLTAHTGDGIRHRAFTCLLFDERGRLLLAQRSAGKRLWDTYWDGTVASHPRDGQSQIEATRERLAEELGLTPPMYENLRVTDSFEYKRYFEDAGVEWEVCSVLKATITDV